MPVEVLVGYIDDTRRNGRLKMRWIHDVEGDLSVMGVWNRIRVVITRKEWRRRVEKAKGHNGI